MKKLRLDVDRLAVESFETGKEKREAGTVRAYVTALNCQTNPDTACGNYLTCAYPTCQTETAQFDCTDPYTCGTCDYTACGC